MSSKKDQLKHRIRLTQKLMENYEMGFIINNVLLPITCAILTAVLFASPWKKVSQIQAEQSTLGLSPYPYFTMVVNTSLWTIYGLLVSSLTILSVNVFGLFCGLYYSRVFYIFCPQQEKNVLNYLYASALVMFTGIILYMFVGSEEDVRFRLGLLGSTFVILMFGSPLLAMKTVIETQSTESMDFRLSLCGTICSFAWTLFGWFVLDDVFVWFPNGVGLLLSLSQLSLFFIYHNSPKV
eukprot:TRINITY_DN314_c0_g1_i2.p1 TRINITY_DN314_c0_g1~~TRINITY_DN314_c0_g1_i2.p1  ORF type:complete len:238 (-),score=23.27 TRINITY_DN314_c0_g1_i2:71-784(-)